MTNAIGKRSVTLRRLCLRTISEHPPNLALAIAIGAIAWFLDPRAWLLVQLPTAILAGTLGVWMFYVQHQFEDVYWETSEQ